MDTILECNYNWKLDCFDRKRIVTRSPKAPGDSLHPTPPLLKSGASRKHRQSSFVAEHSETPNQKGPRMVGHTPQYQCGSFLAHLPRSCCTAWGLNASPRLKQLKRDLKQRCPNKGHPQRAGLRIVCGHRSGCVCVCVCVCGWVRWYSMTLMDHSR